MPRGLDIHQRRPDWEAVKAAGFDFAWLKVSEGGDFPPSDDWYVHNLRAARAAGVRVGGYHFARPDTSESTVEEEAAFFLSRLRLQRGDLKPVLDFEHEPANGQWALRWLEIVRKKIGVRPIFYSYGPFIDKIADVHLPDLRNYPLWLANYGPNDGKRHAVTAPAGFRLVAHQFTSRGRVPSISGDVDLNYAAELRPLIYDPIYRGNYEFVVDGQVVSSGDFIKDGKPTEALLKFRDATRHAEGHGSVRPKE